MTLQTFTSGETPSSTKFQNVSNQTHITVTTAQLVGMATPPTGIHAYNTDLDLDYYYNGSDWILIGGRPIGCTLQIASQTWAAGSDVSLSWDNPATFDTDSFWASGSPTAITIPTGLDGIYAVTFRINAGLGFTDSGGAAGGGYMKIFRGASAYEMPQINAATTGVMSMTTRFDAGDVITLKVARVTGASDTLSAVADVWRVSPYYPTL